MAVLLLQAAFDNSISLRFLRGGGRAYRSIVESILLDRGDSDRIGFKQRFTLRQRIWSQRLAMFSDRLFGTLKSAVRVVIP
jgi:hypothetical protein